MSAQDRRIAAMRCYGKPRLIACSDGWGCFGRGRWHYAASLAAAYRLWLADEPRSFTPVNGPVKFDDVNFGVIEITERTV